MGKTGVRGTFAALVAAVLCGCGSEPDFVTVDGTMLGTTLHVVADVKGVSRQRLYAAVMELDREAKASMSIYDSTSLVSRLNRNETDSVDRHIAFNLHLADSIGALSDGRYDVTVKPLVEAWGFAGRERAENPNVDSILEFVGREKVRVEGGRLVKDDPRVQLDFNSVAKGYTVDLLAGLVEKYGAENYIVDIGGEVRCRGLNRQGRAWRIGVETPFDGNMSDGEYLQKRIQMTGGEYPIEVNVPGKHNVYNALAAICVGREFDVPMDKIAEGIRSFELTKMRLAVEEYNGITIINDCYNASPDSIKAALGVLADTDKKRKILWFLF